LIDRVYQFTVRVRLAFSRTRWTARLLKRPRLARGNRPGLLLLQIDGLPRTQFERGIAEGRLPHLRKLIGRGEHLLTTFYSGCPSTTPAVQAEAMFGERCAVPAFQFFDRASGKVVRMFEAEHARSVGQDLVTRHDPLLRGGSSYSNIYAGGAAEARFCAETLDRDQQRLAARPWRVAATAVLYTFTILRVLGLVILESLLALADVVRGVAAGERFLVELKFIASRIAVTTVLREYLRVVLKLAIEEGSPVIYANFLGYDEQAHRRGPASWFARWTLKGIDNVVGDVIDAAQRSTCHDYEIVVFSDHGQAASRPYERLTGRTIQAAVEECLANTPSAGFNVEMLNPPRRSEDLNLRARSLLHRRRASHGEPTAAKDTTRTVEVTALGPLGHIYLPVPPPDDEKERLAQGLVKRAAVPLTLIRDAAGTTWAFNRAGRWNLAEQPHEVLGPDHAFLADATADLIALCAHRNAGDVVICGYQPGETLVTFVEENGSHGGVAIEEMRGFALVARELIVPRRRTTQGESFLRGEDLYEAGRWLMPGSAAKLARQTKEPLAPCSSQHQTLRVMTYNVHSCIGLDGRARVDRVRRVIAAADADVVALQEVDAHRRRSGLEEQARQLAEALGMGHHYFAVFEERSEQYGLAIISRYPMELVQAALLTPADPRRRREARGAMWASVNAPGGTVQIFNTHFGLTRPERQEQAATLLGAGWLGRLGDEVPVVLCGDLNAGPKSLAYRMLAHRLRDVQAVAAGRRRQATFPSPWPVRRIDHIFVSRHIEMTSVDRIRTHLAVMASDHLPLVAEITLACSGNAARGKTADEPALHG
jgi:endonuclease/exonuclease/phosphatase family metal-dependent hydrolase